MADEPTTQIRGVNWRETFPFTHLFRAFRIAIHPSKLVLGLIALLSLYTGGRLLHGLWPSRQPSAPGGGAVYAETPRPGGRGASLPSPPAPPPAPTPHTT